MFYRKKPKSILFFADKLPPKIGGMEIHAKFFIDYFENHPLFPICSIVTKNDKNQDCLIQDGKLHPISLQMLQNVCDPHFIFFNSGCWIEDFLFLKTQFPRSPFLYRTGGNEIIKAPLKKHNFPFHKDRQQFWATTLNKTIDLLITNSSYTENRLKKINIKTPFFRVVGGVDSNASLIQKYKSYPGLTFFCAARFEPYKNHQLMIDVMKILNDHKIDYQLLLSGDGPLFNAIQDKVKQNHLEKKVIFLGKLDNFEVLQQIANSDIYLQFSKNQKTIVEGGSYIHAEGMGRSILEAITLGTYIITTQSGALNEIITKDRGSILNTQDPKKIATHIISMIPNLPTNTQRCDHYLFNKIFKKYEELFHDIESLNRNRKIQAVT